MTGQPPRNATTRFTDRVADYVKYRPSYPTGVIALLRDRAGLSDSTVVADVGAGTGIFTRLLLDAGVARVFAVEPNPAMRGALVDTLGGDARLQARDGTAEETGLPDAGVDLITSAQAFHWFDRTKARREFERALRPGGAVALVWNRHREDASGFMIAYEALLLRWATEYRQVNHREVVLDSLQPFFAPGPVERHTFPSYQELDFGGARGRLLSSSYAPKEGHPAHEPMQAELRAIFDAHQGGGLVRFEYDTEAYLGWFAR